MAQRYIQSRIFSEGLAGVKDSKNLWGFINRNEEEVISCQFHDVKDFSEGFARVFDGNRSGFINRKGDLITSCKYESTYKKSVKNDYWWGVQDFHEGLAPVCIKSFKTTMYFRGWVNLWGYIDINGNEVIKCKYDFASEFKNGRAIVSKSLNEKGIIDHWGNEIAPCKYSFIGEFHDGLALVKIGYHEHLYGYIDLNGIEVIPCQYYDARPFSEGFAVVLGHWPDNEFRIIDMKGNTIFLNKVYTDARIFSGGLLPVCMDRKWGFIDSCGVERIPFKFDYAENFVGEYAKVRLFGINGLIDRKGRSVVLNNIIDLFLTIDIIGEFKSEYALINHQGKYGLINTNGSYILEPIYDYIGTLYEDRIKVSIGGEWSEDWQNKRYYTEGKYGLVSINSMVISPCIYDVISEFDGSFYRAKRNDDYFFVDKDGTEIKYCNEDWQFLKKYVFNVISELIYELIYEKLAFISPNKLTELIQSYPFNDQKAFDQFCDITIDQYLVDTNINDIINSYKIFINSGVTYRIGDKRDDAWIELISITGEKKPHCYVKYLFEPVYNYKGDTYLESLLPYYYESIYWDQDFSGNFYTVYNEELQKGLCQKSSVLTETIRLKARENYNAHHHRITIKELIPNVIKKAMIDLESDFINKEDKKGIDFGAF